MRQGEKAPEFTSAMSRGELIFSFFWLVMHTVGMGFVLGFIPEFWKLDGASQNFAVYALSAGVMLLFCGGFARRDFDTLCDNFPRIMLEIMRSFLLIFAIDMILSALLSFAAIFGLSFASENQNNEYFYELAEDYEGKIKAMSVFLAPIAEEMLFRGFLFGGIRKRSRIAAYAVSILLFSAYHVWGYALDDPSYWLYMLEYIPVSFVICRLYERSNSIWGSIFFHMGWNALMFELMEAAAELL